MKITTIAALALVTTSLASCTWITNTSTDMMAWADRTMPTQEDFKDKPYQGHPYDDNTVHQPIPAGSPTADNTAPPLPGGTPTVIYSDSQGMKSQPHNFNAAVVPNEPGGGANKLMQQPGL